MNLKTHKKEHATATQTAKYAFPAVVNGPIKVVRHATKIHIRDATTVYMN